MKIIDKILINGDMVTPHGKATKQFANPATGEIIAQVRLADEIDAKNAIVAAQNAYRVCLQAVHGVSGFAVGRGGEVNSLPWLKQRVFSEIDVAFETNRII